MSDTKLGQLIEGDAQRDAIHVAIAPVVAAESLLPGDHVGLLPDGSVSATAENRIGIVDPFLKRRIMKGDKFYLCLYQMTVTGMRHHWSHPAFDVQTPKDPKAESTAWLEDCAEKCGVAYESMMTAIENDDYIHMGQNEHYKSVLDDNYQEFLKHVRIVTGKPEIEPYPFSCSC